MFGKNIRLERIIDRKSGNAVIVPMDHGISVGPIPGLIDMKDTVNNVSEGGATAVLMHKGIIARGHRAGGKDVGLILHLSASTDIGVTSHSKVLVATVEEAIKYGADAVSAISTWVHSRSPRCSAIWVRYRRAVWNGGCRSW